MTSEQAEKLAKFLDVTVDFIWHQYNDSELLRNFYEGLIEKKGY